ncbi:MAG TPA: thiamine-binding protein [Acidimicrobiales bacterium]
MASVRIEFLVEPFVEGAPGPHVVAAIDEARAFGVEPEVGPFGTTVEVDRSAAGSLLQRVVDAALARGATRVAIQVEREP